MTSASAFFDDVAPRRPTPGSALFPQELQFRAHIFQLVENLGLRPQIERGISFGDMALRWDIGIKIGKVCFRIEDLIIECKVKGGMANLERALGQALLYRECRCAKHVVLCFPSDMCIPHLFSQVCERFGLHLTTEAGIQAVVINLLTVNKADAR